MLFSPVVATTSGRRHIFTGGRSSAPKRPCKWNTLTSCDSGVSVSSMNSRISVPPISYEEHVAAERLHSASTLSQSSTDAGTSKGTRSPSHTTPVRGALDAQRMNSPRKRKLKTVLHLDDLINLQARRLRLN